MEKKNQKYGQKRKGPSERHLQEDQQKESETTWRSKRHLEVQIILEEFNGRKSIANIKDKKSFHQHMRNEVGDIEATEKGIGNTFAFFLRRSVLKKER